MESSAVFAEQQDNRSLVSMKTIEEKALPQLQPIEEKDLVLQGDLDEISFRADESVDWFEECAKSSQRVSQLQDILCRKDELIKDIKGQRASLKKEIKSLKESISKNDEFFKLEGAQETLDEMKTILTKLRKDGTTNGPLPMRFYSDKEPAAKEIDSIDQEHLKAVFIIAEEFSQKLVKNKKNHTSEGNVILRSASLDLQRAKSPAKRAKSPTFRDESSSSTDLDEQKIWKIAREDRKLGVLGYSPLMSRSINEMKTLDVEEVPRALQTDRAVNSLNYKFDKHSSMLTYYTNDLSAVDEAREETGEDVESEQN